MLKKADPGVHETPPDTSVRQRRKKRSRRRWFVLLAVLVLAALAGAGYTYWRSGEAPTTQYTFATVQRAMLEDSIAAVGTLAPIRSVEVGAQVSGQLMAVHVSVGDEVEEGQLLAEIDPAIYEAAVEAAEAQLENLAAQLASSQAQLTLTQATLERQESLSTSGSVTQSSLEAAIAQLAAAQASVDGLNAQIRQRQSDLRQAETNLGYTRIYAPLSGTVISQSAEQGQTLAASQSTPVIVTVADLSTMTVESDVSEADVSQLRVGMDTYFTTLGDSATRWTGSLNLIKPAPIVENNVVLYQALFDVPNDDGALMIGMTAQVFFVSASASDVLTVPASAIQTGRGGATTVLVRNGDAIEPRTVEVGLTTRALAEIQSGLEEGDEVVVGQARTTAPATGASEGGGRGAPGGVPGGGAGGMGGGRG